MFAVKGVPSIANMEGKFDTSNKWVVDSGATDHITYKLDWFNSDLKNTHELPVTIPNVSSILCAVTFFPEFCVMHALNSRKLIGVGKCKQGLYQMSMVGSERKAMTVVGDLWHKRPGHATHGKLCLLVFVKNDSLGTNGTFCDCCTRAKFTRLPFPRPLAHIPHNKTGWWSETERALKFEAKFPTRFYGECIMTVSYIINRLPSEVIGNKTPYEIVYGQKPDYEGLKVFGCLAYYLSIEMRCNKFEERGTPGIFLGYPRGTKGYKIYDVKNGKIIVSRDVRFVENIFPYGSQIDHEEDEELENFEFPTWYYDDQNPYENMSNIHEENDMEPKNENDDMEENMHEDDVVMQNDANSGDLPQNEGQTQVAEPMAEIENIGHASVTKPTTQTEIEHEEPIREKRSRTRPARLNDYVVNLPPSIDQTSPESNQQSSTVYPIANFISYYKFSDSHKAFLTAISLNDEPKTFKQAVQDEN
ncbi:uncharacterized protein LOC143579028 [Bidens hawaiensis]|uniref:uncharacterized protein LOC143579028 n=1 Tax=Bidens hawaiensis TaxID=980011 RepID=UPI0040491914